MNKLKEKIISIISSITGMTNIANTADQILEAVSESRVVRRRKHILICDKCARKYDLWDISQASDLCVLRGMNGPCCHFCGKDNGGADICVSA